MNVHLHIERLSIRIPGVTRSQRGLVSVAIEQELTRLLASGELAAAPHPRSAGWIPGREPGAPAAESRLKLGQDHGPSALGAEIAKAVYGRVAAAAAAQGPEPPPNRHHATAAVKGAGR